MEIRAYRPADRAAVERINYDTGLLGRPLTELGVSRALIARGIAAYFEKHAEHIIVADAGEAGVGGYVFGEPGGTRRNEKLLILRRILGNLCRLPFVSGPDRRYIANHVSVVISAALGRAEEGRFSTPPGAGHLHINLLPEYRGGGTGSALLAAFLERMERQKVRTVYADSYLTARNPNRNFWIRNGFSEYSRIKSSVWKRTFPGEDIYLVCYAKEIA